MMKLEAGIFGDPWDGYTMNQCISGSGFRSWVAMMDGAVRGYVSAVSGSKKLHIINLAVEKDYRNMGFGRCLLKAAEGWGRRLGAAGCFLEVRESSIPAISLYRKCGYRESGLVEDYYADGESGVLMTKPVTPLEPFSQMAGIILERWGRIPRVGVVLGSGLSWLADAFEAADHIPYGEIMERTDPHVPGHPGKMSRSRCGGYAFFLGRRHYYQGYDGEEIALLPAVLSDLGVTRWILTSSSGAVDHSLRPGDAVLFRDHVNFAGCIPEDPPCRTGWKIYSPGLRAAAHRAADTAGVSISEGTFAAVSGPAYETSAEIRFLQRKGMATVSMSTVPEVLMLASLGCEVAALSLVTNAASPGAVLTHSEVLSSQEAVREKQGRFLDAFIREAATYELP